MYQNEIPFYILNGCLFTSVIALVSLVQNIKRAHKNKNETTEMFQKMLKDDDKEKKHFSKTAARKKK